MGVTPPAKPAPESAHNGHPCCSSAPWVRYAAAGTLIAGGGLLLSGKRKPGLIAAVAGASLAMLDQKETVRFWWNRLPETINQAQTVLGQVQHTLDEVAVQRDKLAKVLHRSPSV